MEGLKTIPIFLGRDQTIWLEYGISLIAPALLLVGIFTGEVPGFTLVLLIFTAYDLYYIKLADAHGEEGMKQQYYLIADCEFLLWPAVVWIGQGLLDWLGPLLTVVLAVLIVIAVGKLFTGRRASKSPPVKSLP